jgi:predicted glycoside hydrolase/deacetylase ChbG (UPF0249 family)
VDPSCCKAPLQRIIRERRRLIVNADDFGISEEVNAGIIAAHRNGVVTSASLMVRWTAAADAAVLARHNPRLSLGLHVDLGEWEHHAGDWRAVYEVVSLNDLDAIRSEIRRQLDAFRRLVGADPTHLDSHQHVHRGEPTKSAMLGLASELAIPLRHFDRRIRYCGDFYGQTRHGTPLVEAISVSAFVDIIRALPAGITELACHPGRSNSLRGMYRRERAMELQSLCHLDVRQAIRNFNVDLCSFREVDAFAQ